jgi:hypothetical protein
MLYILSYLSAKRQVAFKAHLQISYLTTARTRRVALVVQRLFLEKSKHYAASGQLGGIVQIVNVVLALRTGEFIMLRWHVNQVLDTLEAVCVLAG